MGIASILAENERLRAALTERDRTLAERDQILTERERAITERDAKIAALMGADRHEKNVERWHLGNRTFST